MNTTIDCVTAHTEVVSPAERETDSSGVNPGSEPAPRPLTIVLQPNGSLDYRNSSEFQRMLETALDHSEDGVIVDLLWVDSTDPAGVTALVAGIQRAAFLGKMLSFQAMDVSTRTALEKEWMRQREINFGPWNDLFGKELEQFLDGLIWK